MSNPNPRRYPCPRGVSDQTHERFLAVVERATLASALPDEMLAEPHDDEEVDPEGGTATAGDPEEDLGAGVEVH